MSLVKRFWHAVRLFVVFLYDLLVSSVQVARAVIWPGDVSAPRLVTVPVEGLTDTEITLIANFISLTPGTLSVDVSEDGSQLLVHDMFGGQSGDGTRLAIRNGIQARVLRVTRS